MGVRYIGAKLSTGAIRHSKTRLAQTAGRGALEPRNSCPIYIIRRRYRAYYITFSRAFSRCISDRYPLLLLFLDALAGLPMVVLAPLPLLLVLACTAAVAAIPTRIIIGANYVPCVFLLLAALRCQPSSRQQIYWQHWLISLLLAGRSSRDQRQHTHTDAGSQTDP